MKQYSHNYTKAADAESHLYAAQQLNAHDDPIEAWKHIEDARRLLQEYLAIINHCQKILLCPEFGSVEQFRNNKSNKWTETQTYNHN